MDNNVNIDRIDRELGWIQPSINSLDLSFYTQKIIDGIYSVVDAKSETPAHIDQSWYWSDEWQLGEKRVDEYIQMGNIEEFDTIEDFLTTLRE